MPRCFESSSARKRRAAKGSRVHARGVCDMIALLCLRATVCERLFASTRSRFAVGHPQAIYIYIYMCMYYIYIYMYVFIYLSIYFSFSLSLCVYIYIYRERDTIMMSVRAPSAAVTVNASLIHRYVACLDKLTYYR